MPKRITTSSLTTTKDIINPSDITRQYNTYDDYIEDMVEGAVTTYFSTSSSNSFTVDDVKEWLSDPDKYYSEICGVVAYLYYTDGNMYQFINTYVSLPSLNYKIKVFNNTQKGYEENIAIINKCLTTLKYKELLRDILVQLCTTGTIVTTWLGDKKNPYLYLFNNSKYVFPSHRENGKWVVKLDMAWFDEMEDEERQMMFITFKSFVTEQDYNKYKSNTSDEQLKYITLPIETTYCFRINTLFRNQRRGLPMGTAYLFEYLHKQKFKDLEKSIANKIIKNAMVLTIGNKDVPNQTINPKVKKKIANGVNNALKNQTAIEGTPIIVVPEYADLSFNDMDGFDGLTQDKYKSINADISTSIGIVEGLLTGDGNGSTLKYNLQLIYRKIAVILEGIEPILNQLLPIILPSSKANNFYIEIDKTQPLETEKVLDVLYKLHSEGFAIKPILDYLPEIDMDEYIKRSLYEQDSGLYDKIKPPQTSSTLSSGDNLNDSKSSDLQNDDPDIESTIRSKDSKDN